MTFQKIHKTETSLRPIVSSRNSPCHPLAKYLVTVLKPLAGKSVSFPKNSKDFVAKIKDIHTNKTDTLVSFDIVSLFTNVPIAESLTIVRNKLERY